MRSCGKVVLTVVLGALGGCATTSTELAPVAPERVRAEEAHQRRLVIQERRAEQARLDSVAFPILAAGTELCEDATTHLWGFRWNAASRYEGEWRAAARAEGIGDTVSVVGVVPRSPADVAGLRVGDRLLAVDAHPLPPGQEGIEAMTTALARAEEGEGRLRLEARRGAERIEIGLEGVPGCGYGHLVTAEGGINAYADGRNIVVPWAMMRFVQDDELQVVVAHEIAHNAMGHLDARKKNSLLGGLLGALGDVALASAGIDSGGLLTENGLAMGAQAFSPDFEREADYVGMYLLARAGLPLASASDLWRQFAQIDPNAIAFASSHPTTAERFVRLEQTAMEIEAKRAEGALLLPNLANR